MDALVSLRRTTGAARCLACGKCTTMCPLAHGGGFSARRIASQDLQEEIEGRGVGIGRCLTCASCEVRCPEGVQFTEFVRGLRALIPPEARRRAPHGGVFQTVARSMSEAIDRRRKPNWVGDHLEIAETGPVALFVGCAPYFDAYFADLGVHTLDSARAAIAILNRQGIRPVVVAEERCCGHDLLWQGDREPYEQLARANVEAFEARGIRHIITTCAECTRTWKVDYPEVVPEYTPRVEHFSEYLAGLVRSGKVEFREPGSSRTNGTRKLTYQDPCRLGRHLGVLDEPRRVFEAFPDTQLMEMPRSGRDAVCCGTSGFIHCDAASRRLQEQRLGEAAQTGADTLVTACPKCLIHFACAQSEDRRRTGTEPRIQVEDFTVLAARLLVPEDEQTEEVPVPSGQEAGEAR